MILLLATRDEREGSQSGCGERKRRRGGEVREDCIYTPRVQARMSLSLTGWNHSSGPSLLTIVYCQKWNIYGFNSPSNLHPSYYCLLPEMKYPCVQFLLKSPHLLLLFSPKRETFRRQFTLEFPHFPLFFTLNREMFRPLYLSFWNSTDLSDNEPYSKSLQLNVRTQS